MTDQQPAHTSTENTELPNNSVENIPSISVQDCSIEQTAVTQADESHQAQQEEPFQDASENNAAEQKNENLEEPLTSTITLVNDSQVNVSDNNEPSQELKDEEQTSLTGDNHTLVHHASQMTLVPETAEKSTEDSLEKEKTEVKDVETGVSTEVIPWRKHNRARRFFCCSCLPLWAAGITWGVLISIFIVICTFIGLLLPVFMPTVSITGFIPPGSDGVQVDLDTGSVNITVGLNATVYNPYKRNIQLYNMEAKAYYGDFDTVLGDGTLDYFYLPSDQNTTFTFPFTVHFSTTDASDMAILFDLATRCGFTGLDSSSITIQYTMTTMAEVIGFKIYPTLDGDITVNCPGASIMEQISSLVNGTIGSNIASEFNLSD